MCGCPLVEHAGEQVRHRLGTGVARGDRLALLARRIPNRGDDNQHRDKQKQTRAHKPQGAPTTRARETATTRSPRAKTGGINPRITDSYRNTSHTS